MDTIKIESVYIKEPTARTREETFGVLVVSKKSPAIALNEDAKIVWERIDGKATVDDIISNISNDYDDKENVKNKVVETIKGLIKANLIKENEMAK